MNPKNDWLAFHLLPLGWQATHRRSNITTATLDNPGHFPPTVEIWVSEKIEWEALHPGLPKREWSSLNE